VDFLVLGAVEVRGDRGPLDLGGARQRSVLARLLISPGEIVAVDRLIDDIWRGEPAPSALGVLQTYISNLRRVLEPRRPARAPAQVLVTRDPGYALLARTDAGKFVGLVNNGIEHLGAGAAHEAVVALDRSYGQFGRRVRF
jgi:DNA-binding SARP family transcriptional activator